MRRIVALLSGVLVLSACGSGAGRTEVQLQRQVSKCLPTAGGVPDPLLLRRTSVRATFASCTGVAKHAKAFDACAVKVLVGGLPTVARLEKGLTMCVAKNA